MTKEKEKARKEYKQDFDRSKYISGIDPMVKETLKETYSVGKIVSLSKNSK
jgi:hypothetical protein